MNIQKLTKTRDDFIDRFSTIRAEALDDGDHFVARNGLSGHVSVYEVVKKTEKYLKIRKAGVTAIETHSFKKIASKPYRWTLLDNADVKKLAEFEDAIAVAHAHQAGYTKRSMDRYVLWNYDFEDIDDKFNRSGEQREGFVIEVFDGNGKLLHRTRMMSDGGIDVLHTYGDKEQVERMAEAYAECFRNTDPCDTEAVFHVQQITEMD